jgi:hypothetical protein
MINGPGPTVIFKLFFLLYEMMGINRHSDDNGLPVYKLRQEKHSF